MNKEIWNEFLSGNHSYFDDDDGHFYFEEIKLDNNDQYQWLLVRNVKPELIKESFDKEGLTTIFIFLVLFLILSPTTVVFFYYREVNKKYREEIENNVKYDVLTGLYNRRQALIELRNKSNYYRRYGGNFVIAYIDINSLKYVNDEYGHDMGDTLLKGFSEIVKNEIRGTDVACRMGGDEFIIMFDQCNETDAYHIIIRITKYFKERGKLFMDFPWTFAYGIKRYDKNLEMDELLILADKAMYEHKNEMKKQDKSLDR
jgi:diguanylate cyclase (GGDEF)-like protein